MDQQSVNVNGAVPKYSEKPEKFKGLDFKRWQQKMLFFLTTMNLAHVVKEEAPKSNENPMTGETAMAIEAWTHSEFCCRNYILNSLDDNLYDIYSLCKTAKELWESLEKKYKIDDAGSKKFVIGKFLKYTMVDSKSVVSQVEEIQKLIYELHSEGCEINEHFQVGAIIEKLPTSWNDFKIYLKHKRREMNMEDLILRLRVEEDHRKADRSGGFAAIEANANYVEGGNSKAKPNKNKAPKTKQFVQSALAPKGKNLKKIKGACYVCGKSGHKAQDCYHRKDGNHAHGNNNNHVNMATTNVELAAVVSEVNMVSNVSEWLLDTGATKHICADRNLFTEYHPAAPGEKLYMGNSASSAVEGKGKVILKFTSGKSLTLLNVLHVPEIRRNLVSGPILITKGFKLVMESNKFVLTKGGMFVGKGYVADGLVKLNVIAIDDANKINASTYIVESSNIWHARLGHVNFRSMHRMVKLDLLPKFEIDFNHKCETCIESKFARQTRKSIMERSNELLGLIHSDLCDFKSTPTRGGKNYYVTFIDDCSKYCYVYLIHSKDEALNMFKTYKAEVENQLERKIKALRSDRGGEYESTAFSDFCAQHGIIHQTTAPYTPQQNGVAERKNRTFKDMINSMLNSSGLPHSLWGEALLTANAILNKVPLKKIDESPYELWK